MALFHADSASCLFSETGLAPEYKQDLTRPNTIPSSFMDLPAAAVAIAGQSSNSLWASASSSCSSLVSNSNVKRPFKVMGVDDEDMVMGDACSTTPSPRDQTSEQPVSPNTDTIDISTSLTTTRIMDDITIITTISTTTLSSTQQQHEGHGRAQQSYANLPSELILYIFKFLLAAHDLRSAILVCKLWCSCGMDLLWSKPSLMTLSDAEKMIHAMSLPRSIFPYADYIRRLNLSFLAPDVSDSMLTRFASCSRLERLLLAGSVNITAEGLNRILSSCSGLCSLDLSEIPAVTDALLESVAKACPKLHTLYIGSCSAITDEFMVKLATSCSHLKRIKLSQCGLLTDRSIMALTEHCPQLIEIDLTGCSLVSSDAIQSVFEQLPQIRDINMSLLANITSAAFTSIHPSTHRFEQLRALNLTSCALITDEALIRIIPAAPRLRSLALTKCDKITDAGASVIKILGKHLHYLHLGHCVKITDRLVATLAQHCTRIRYLDLACCSRLTDAAVFALAQLPKLRRIGLVKCSNITDHGIYAMLVSQVLSQTLERVHLSYCVHLSEGAVAALVSQCSKLTHLSVTGVPAFISPRYQKFCRAPPSEFTAHQREVFCVFSGKGVRELRHYMQENPAAAPSMASMASIRASYRRISSSVASMITGSEQMGMQEIGDGDENMEEMQQESWGSPSLEATTILAQMGPHLMATGAGVVALPGTAMISTSAMGQDLETMFAGQEQDMEDVVMRGISSSSPSLLAGEASPTTAVQGSLVFLEGPSAAGQAIRPFRHDIDGDDDVTFHTSSGHSTSFPVLQHPHHYHGHGHGQHSSGLGDETDHQGRLPSPGTLARSLDREGEGSGAGSASPAEEEEDDEDEDF